MTKEEKRAKMLKNLAILMERSKEIDVDPVWTECGRAIGESVWEGIKPYLAVSGTAQER